MRSRRDLSGRENAVHAEVLGELTGSTCVGSTASSIGRVTTSGGGGMRVLYQYDVRGRPTLVQHAFEGTCYSRTTTYGDPLGGVVPGGGSVPKTETFPDGEQVSYGYDASDALVSIASSAVGTIVSRILRNAKGQTLEVDYSDTSITKHTYKDSSDLRLF
jgi:YD repeat-containing protein